VEATLTPSETPSSSRPEARPIRLQVRLSADEKAVIRHAAALRGSSLSDFVASSALAAAEETIREHEVITLSPRESPALAEALLNPKGPNEALRKAVRDHRELLGS
jgi:uncharacterized protein (DUF1778 family)